MADFYEMMALSNQKKELKRVMDCNGHSSEFGLSLREEEVKELLVCRQNALKAQRRVEFGKGILPELIEAFCDSDYIPQEQYGDILKGLQELFYLYKNESMDRLADDELILYMRQQFEEVCRGSLEYLGTTCLERFARAVRNGYEPLSRTGGCDEYGMRDIQDDYTQLSEEEAWSRELFFTALDDLM